MYIPTHKNTHTPRPRRPVNLKRTNERFDAFRMVLGAKMARTNNRSGSAWVYITSYAFEFHGMYNTLQLSTSYISKIITDILLM